MKTLINRKQIQLNVCRALLENNGRCRACKINEKEIAVTIDGYTAYVFGVNECVFDTEKITTAEGLKPFFDDVENDTEITPSNELYNLNGKIVEKYIGQDIEVFVDTEVIKQFKGFKLYANSSRGRILVKDCFDRIIGLCLPMRFNYEDVKRGTNK